MHDTSRAERGFTLLEALIAMMITSLIVLSYLGIRTNALVDATQARNWRLAREIAEEKMSELQAGARDSMPENGLRIPLEKYEGFEYEIVIGETNVADVEGELVNNAAGEDTEARDRADWQRRRDDYRKASSRGLSAIEYSDQRSEDVNLRLAEKVPSDTDFEEVAVIVYFPKLGASFEGEKDALMIKARLSTLAISSRTPQEAQLEAAARGQSSAGAGSGDPAGSGGSTPSGGGSPTPGGASR